MADNPAPWIIMGLAALAVFAWKRGLFHLPSLKSASVKKEIGNTIMDASNLTSHELGIMFAQAKKREAELETAAEFAIQAGDSLKTAFKAPFASAAPAPATQEPPAPGV